MASSIDLAAAAREGGVMVGEAREREVMAEAVAALTSTTHPSGLVDWLERLGAARATA